MKSDPWYMSESDKYHIYAWLIKAFGVILRVWFSLSSYLPVKRIQLRPSRLTDRGAMQQEEPGFLRD